MSFLHRFFFTRPKLRRAVTRLLEGEREVEVSLLGAKLRVHSVKEHGYLRSSRLAKNSALFRDEAPVLLNLAALLADGDTFVDIGANVGIYSLTLARMRALLPKTKFYAFEANPDTFSRLAAHAREMGVVAHNIALSDHEGTLQFVAGAVSHVFTTVDNATSYSLAGETSAVPCKRLDQFDIAGDSLILKIDVEGQEKAVLDGASQFFVKKRVKAVYLDGCKEQAAVEDFLRGHGFAFLEGRTLAPTQGGVFSLLALRPEK
ncbi:MAG TPA: FkbM family methyltransferase [Chthoniobacteraceae bacterium]|nr:FkbM family methyltransferase [Chthoniobacteraceae bacterium]